MPAQNALRCRLVCIHIHVHIAQARQEAKEASLAAAAAEREHENQIRALQRHLDLDFKRNRVHLIIICLKQESCWELCRHILCFMHAPASRHAAALR